MDEPLYGCENDVMQKQKDEDLTFLAHNLREDSFGTGRSVLRQGGVQKCCLRIPRREPQDLDKEVLWLRRPIQGLDHICHRLDRHRGITSRLA